MVYSKCEGIPRGVSTCISGSRYIYRKKIRNVVRNTCSERRRIILLKDVKIRKRFEKDVIKLVDVGAQNLW